MSPARSCEEYAQQSGGTHHLKISVQRNLVFTHTNDLLRLRVDTRMRVSALHKYVGVERIGRQLAGCGPPNCLLIGTGE